MAKFTSRPSIPEMEERLGFTANSMTPPDPATERFYCDLKPVPDNTSKQLFREYDELNKTNQTHRRMAKPSLVLPKMGESLVIEYDGNRVVITRADRVGFYIYSIDISYNGGFFLPLLFTENEASWAISAAKFPSIETPHDDSPFLKLPRELREKIYSFALPQRELGIKDIDAFDHLIFPAGVGDPSGFFFQLEKEPTILKASRQIRQEALPFVYRNTTFCLDDMDDVVKFLVAIGRIGRSNITSLQFPWESMNDIGRKVEQSPHDDDSGPILPSLHALRCVQLLKECRRLQFLQICLDQDIFENTSVHEFMADPGIAALCTLRGIRTLEVVDNTDESLEEHPAVKRLHEEMKMANK
ncbi:hypothetical protein BGZ61DRAFT_465405 [Ilyonectria robusta]|uniref:uncharacterized protein n=1 Tax=Ilyonectria robusta TaxID=1079257 RepID=UPI001E8CADEC|nr:uncharacterized protein BGZ61DRAFT_465405 [Ilyonectria robusta]KAH8659474.1 hypothetical protein BGZ61DRAFT_465405 [Ilyonectria robusta]